MQLFIKLFGIAILSVLFCNSAFAQKLPSIQHESLRAPANVRVDGRLTEWKTPIRAQNNAIEAGYTIANDDVNLYLVIQATESQTVKKILGGSITFSITLNDKTPERAELTFPLLKTGQKNILGKTYNSRFDAYGIPEPARTQKTDSILSELNTEVGKDMKEIKFFGMQGQTDSLVSVFNTEGFKAAINFDKQFNLTMEIAIPISALGLTVDSPVFSYKISINGISFSDATIRMPPNASNIASITTMPRSITAGGVGMQAMGSTTYCKGTYTLVK